MKVSFFQEPELKFGTGRHIDIKFGLMNYGPLDFDDPLAPRNIRMGIVGTTQTIEGVEQWLENCQNGISAKASHQPNLFPKFPGFGDNSNLSAPIITSSQLQRTISSETIDNLSSLHGSNEIVSSAVELFYNELKYLAENTNANVLICALPVSLLEHINPEDENNSDLDTFDGIEVGKVRFDFRDFLKAKSMDIGVPTQLILPTTYGKPKRKLYKQKTRQLQDEATRAWNFYTALYYKAGGKPWRLLRDSSELTTCYVGVGFYKSLDQQKMLTSVAQVFNERGDGVIVRGGVATISKDDLQPHLSINDAYDLLANALETYRNEHKTLPARVVVHKTSTYSAEEMEGIKEATRSYQVYICDLISITKTFTRLFRIGAYPPLRGTFLALDEISNVIYTRGSVDFFSTYPGMYVPRPLLFRCENVEQTSKYIAREIMLLTKMNWNNTQFDNSEPITIRAAREVGAVLKYAGEKIQPRYSFYM